MVHVPISVDTYHAAVAEAAVEAGADLINDISGGALDAQMLPTAARLGAPIVLMHMRGCPDTMFEPANTTYECVWRDTGRELAARFEAAAAAGVPAFNVILDPGLGFSKTQRQSAELLGKLGAMRAEALPGVLGRLPMLVGPSRKRFIGSITGGCRSRGQGGRARRMEGEREAVPGAECERPVASLPLRPTARRS
jgi:2-amino-4-hydroxy-6-hydroxymethyldihydropteridine diphosphokinase/dihydropteroate synthase